MCIFATDMQRIIYILVVMGILTACESHRDKAVKTLLDSVSVVMEEHPERADTLLSSLEDSVTELSTPQRIQYYLLRAEASYKLDKQMPSDTVFQEVVDYYDRHGNANQRMKAYYLMGGIYRYRHEAPMALQWYLDATEQADTLSPDCDNWTLMKVYGQMAELYHSQLMPKEEIKSRRQFSKYAEKAGNTYQAIRGIEKQLGAYQLMGDTAMILTLTDSVHKLYTQADMPQAAASVYHAAIYILLARHDYPKAKELMDIFEHESGLFDAKGSIAKSREHYYQSKGLYYEGIGKLDSAEYYYRRLLPYGFELDAYRGLISVFKTRQITDSVVSFIPLYEKSFNAYRSNYHAQAMRQVDAMYDYSRNQKIAQQKEIETIKTRYTLYIILIISIILFFILFWINDKKRRHHKAEVLQLHMEYESVQEQIEIAEKGLQQFKSDALQFEQHQEEQIRQLKKEKNLLVTQLNGLDVKEDDTTMLQTAIYQRFKEKADYWNKFPELTINDWHVLHTEFQNHFPRLYKKFTYSKLTDKQIDIAMLVRLRFSSGDIQRIMGLEKQAVSNYKNRISQKLYNLDSSKKLFTYLTSFYLEEDSEHVKESSL